MALKRKSAPPAGPGPPTKEQIRLTLRKHIMRKCARLKQEENPNFEIKNKVNLNTLSLENVNKQLEVLEDRLKSLKDEKQTLFVQLKKVLNENDNRKRQQHLQLQKQQQQRTLELSRTNGNYNSEYSSSRIESSRDGIPRYSSAGLLSIGSANKNLIPLSSKRPRSPVEDPVSKFKRRNSYGDVQNISHTHGKGDSLKTANKVDLSPIHDHSKGSSRSSSSSNYSPGFSNINIINRTHNHHTSYRNSRLSDKHNDASHKSINIDKYHDSFNSRVTIHHVRDPQMNKHNSRKDNNSSYRPYFENNNQQNTSQSEPFSSKEYYSSSRYSQNNYNRNRYSSEHHRFDSRHSNQEYSRPRIYEFEKNHFPSQSTSNSFRQHHTPNNRDNNYRPKERSREPFNTSPAYGNHHRQTNCNPSHRSNHYLKRYES